MILADHTPMQLGLHSEELVALVLVDGVQRHPRPGRDHLVNVLSTDFDGPRPRLHVELLSNELEALARDDLLLLEELGFLIVLLSRSALHLLDGYANTSIDIPEFVADTSLAQLGPGPGFVDQVNRFVWEESLSDIPAGLIDRRFDGRRRILDVVEALVPVLHAQEHLQGLRLARRGHLDRLKATLQGPVLLDVLAVLGRGRGTDAPDFTARQRRLQDVGGVQRPFGRAGTDKRMKLVNEDDDAGVLHQLFHDRLETLFKLAAILGSRHDEGDIQGQDALVRQKMGMVVQLRLRVVT